MSRRRCRRLAGVATAFKMTVTERRLRRDRRRCIRSRPRCSRRRAPRCRRRSWRGGGRRWPAESHRSRGTRAARRTRRAALRRRAGGSSAAHPGPGNTPTSYHTTCRRDARRDVELEAVDRRRPARRERRERDQDEPGDERRAPSAPAPAGGAARSWSHRLAHRRRLLTHDDHAAHLRRGRIRARHLEPVLADSDACA